MKIKRFLAIAVAVAALFTVTSCDKDGEEALVPYAVTYTLSNMGDIADFAEVNVSYTGDFNYELTQSNIDALPWSVTVEDVYGDSCTMTISFTKRSDTSSATIRTQYNGTTAYSIAKSTQYDGDDYDDVSASNVKTVPAAEWDAYINELVNNPIVVELDL